MSGNLTPKISMWEMWPTRLMAFEFDDKEFDKRLTYLVIKTYKERSGNETIPLNEELRVYDFFSIDHPDVETLRVRVLKAVETYLGEPGKKWCDGFELTGRAVIITNQSFILTHVERRESDLTIPYFPTGDGTDQPVHSLANPQFYAQDPSRYLTDLRLPHEQNHSFGIAPRPGLMMIFPSHIPHGQHPYTGEFPHIQIVCNVKIKFKEGYFVQRW